LVWLLAYSAAAATAAAANDDDDDDVVCSEVVSSLADYNNYRFNEYVARNTAIKSSNAVQVNLPVNPLYVFIRTRQNDCRMSTCSVQMPRVGEPSYLPG